VLQCVSVYFSLLQCVAMCSARHDSRAACVAVLQYVAVSCSVLKGEKKLKSCGM